MLTALTDYGITGRAIKKGLIQLRCWNPRDFTKDKHHTVDDRPYGGGPGMLMKVQPLQDAIRAAVAANEGARVIYLSPQGQRLNHQKIVDLSSCKGLVLVAGRYEGVDERLIETEIDEELSLGDFVLSGGELPAMALIDAVSRLIPDVLGHQDSAITDSFYDGLLDYPQYTRPEIFADMQVPEILLSGDHEEIRRWRLKQQLGRTWLRRPDLLKLLNMNAEQQMLLTDFIQETQGSDD